MSLDERCSRPIGTRHDIDRDVASEVWAGYQLGKCGGCHRDRIMVNANDRCIICEPREALRERAEPASPSPQSRPKFQVTDQYLREAKREMRRRHFRLMRLSVSKDYRIRRGPRASAT